MPHAKGQPWLKRPRKGVVPSALAIGIEYWRQRAGALKMDLAKKAGMSPAALVMLTRGSRGTRSETIDKIAEALGVSTAALYARIDDDLLDWVRDRPEAVRAFKLLTELGNGDMEMFKELGSAIQKNERAVRKFLKELAEASSDDRR